MGYIGYHVTAQLFHALQAIRHGVESISEYTHLPAGFHLHTLGEITMFHFTGCMGQCIDRSEDTLREYQGKEDGQQSSSQDGDDDRLIHRGDETLLDLLQVGDI